MRGSKGGGGGWVSRILLGLFHKEYIFIVGFRFSTAKRKGVIIGDQEGCRLGLKPAPDES
jgi:hypothetical protein